MGVNLEMTNALNDFGIFIKLLNQGEKSAAFGPAFLLDVAQP